MYDFFFFWDLDLSFDGRSLYRLRRAWAALFFFYWNPRAAPGRIPATELITAMDKLVFVDRERGNFVGEGWL